MNELSPAAAAGTFALGGDLTVNRLGDGAMRLSGPGIMGPPKDGDEAIAVLREAVASVSITSIPATTTGLIWSTS